MLVLHVLLILECNKKDIYETLESLSGEEYVLSQKIVYSWSVFDYQLRMVFFSTHQISSGRIEGLE